MEIEYSNSFFEEAFYFIKSKHFRSPRFVQGPDFLSHLNNIIDGFKPGELTIVSGEKTEAFFTSLLYDLSCKKNVYCYVISNKYSKTFIGLNLLKYEMAELKPWNLCLNKIYSGYFEDEQIKTLEKKHSGLLQTREEKKLGNSIPVSLSRFAEKNIDEICENIRAEIDRFDSSSEENGQKRIILISGINNEDLKQIKTLAEIYHVPIIALGSFLEGAPYADKEITIKKSPAQYPSIASTFRMFSLNVKNNVTLEECEGLIKYDYKLKAFISESDATDFSKPAITQQEINEILNETNSIQKKSTYIFPEDS